MRYAILTVATLTLVAVAIVLTVWDRFTTALLEPAGTGAGPVVVTVAKGETMLDLLPKLSERGLIRDVEAVRLYLERFHARRPLIPGDYSLSAAMGPAELVAHLESGRRVKRPVSIPECATLEAVAKLLGDAGILDPGEFLSVAEDREFVARLGVTGRRLEGYLLPEVYTFARGTAPEVVLESMVTAFNYAFDQRVGDRTNGLTRSQVVVLASLIDQTPIPRSELRQLSALLRNRLRSGIPLQIEAARAYAQRFDETRRARWDTFSEPGLPPGPICSPGTGAVLAAADPASSRALYMVERDNGSHVFCDDLDCLYEESRRYKRKLPRPLPLPESAPRAIDPALEAPSGPGIDLFDPEEPPPPPPPSPLPARRPRADPPVSPPRADPPEPPPRADPPEPPPRADPPEPPPRTDPPEPPPPADPPEQPL